MEETVSRDDVSRGARFFEDADCRLGDRVVCNDIIVAREKDAGLGAVENMISRDTRLTALNANTIENACGEGFVSVDPTIVPVEEDIDLADASSLAGDLHAVGLADENVGGDGGAGGNVSVRGPDSSPLI